MRSVLILLPCRERRRIPPSESFLTCSTGEKVGMHDIRKSVLGHWVRQTPRMLKVGLEMLKITEKVRSTCFHVYTRGGPRGLRPNERRDIDLHRPSPTLRTFPSQPAPFKLLSFSHFFQVILLHSHTFNSTTYLHIISPTSITEMSKDQYDKTDVKATRKQQSDL